MTSVNEQCDEAAHAHGIGDFGDPQGRERSRCYFLQAREMGCRMPLDEYL